MLRRILLLIFLCTTLGACAGPRPILYPNEQLKAVGEEAAQADIAGCQERAEAATSNPQEAKAKRTAEGTVAGGAVGAASGAVGGAVVGAAGRGSAIGAAAGATAGLVRGLFSSPAPSPAYKNFVNRCLSERGYDVVGWE